MATLALAIDALRAQHGAGAFDRAVRRVSRSSQQGSRDVRKLDRNVDAFGRTARLVGRSLAGFGIALGVRGLADLSDASTNAANRLRLVTSEGREFAAVQARLFAVSKENFAALTSTAEVYQRVAKGAGEAGLSTQLAVEATEAVSAAVRLSGVTAEAARNAVVQFGQGLAAGALRGDELRSVLEQTPALADAVAKSIGTTVGQLRRLGAEGAITTERILPGLAAQLERLRGETAKLAPTFSQAFENVKTSATIAIGDFNNVSTGAAGLTQSIAGLSDFIETDLIDAFAFLAVQLGQTIGFAKDFAIGFTTALDSVADAFFDSEESAQQFFGTLGQLAADTVPNAIALIKLFSTEVVTFFAQAETDIRSLFKNFQLADAQRAGETETVERLRRELAGLAEERKTEAAFREDNIRKILQERDANIEASASIKARLQAEREARRAALGDIGGLSGRAGGIEEGAPVAGGGDEIDKTLQRLINSTSTPFEQALARINELRAAVSEGLPSENFLFGVTEAVNELAGTRASIEEFQRALNIAIGEGVGPENIEILRGFDLTADQLRETLTAYQAINPGATMEEFVAALELGRETTLEVRTAQQVYNDELERYRNLLDAGIISADAFAQKQEQLKEEVFGLTDLFKSFSEEAGRSIQRSFADFLFDPFSEGLEGMARGFLDTMRRIAAEALASSILRGIFGGLSNLGGPIGGFAQAALSGLTQRQNGGDLRRGEIGLVGEREPELRVPKEPETILNGRQMAALSPNIQNNVFLDAKAFTQALASPQGSRDLVEAVAINKSAIRAALN